MLVIGECKSKVLPFNILCNEIFSPEEDTNKDTCTILVVTAAKALLSEIWDEKKATTEHISSAGVRFCWDNTSDDDHVDSLLKMIVDDPVKRYFGAITYHIKPYR